MNIYDILGKLLIMEEERKKKLRHRIFIFELLLIFFPINFWNFIILILILNILIIILVDKNHFIYNIFIGDEKKALNEISSYSLTVEQENSLMKFYFPYLRGSYEEIETAFHQKINQIFSLAYIKELYNYSALIRNFSFKKKLTEEEILMLSKIYIALFHEINLIKKYKLSIDLRKEVEEIFSGKIEGIKKIENINFDEIIEWEV